MLTIEELTTWGEALELWRRDRDLSALAEAMAGLSPAEREQVFAQIGCDRLRSELEQILRALRAGV